jgi:hypothetical protein
VDELENITKTGKKQCAQLGKYIADKYVNGPYPVGVNPEYFWSCSKSSRAKESGVDFVFGMNNAMRVPVNFPYSYCRFLEGQMCLCYIDGAGRTVEV